MLPIRKFEVACQTEFFPELQVEHVKNLIDRKSDNGWYREKQIIIGILVTFHKDN